MTTPPQAFYCVGRDFDLIDSEEYKKKTCWRVEVYNQSGILIAIAVEDKDAGVKLVKALEKNLHNPCRLVNFVPVVTVQRHVVNCL